MSAPILEVKKLDKTFDIKKMFKKPLHLKALSDINFELGPEETLGIVGESGCGKSTLAKVLTKLEAPTNGSIELLNKNYNDYDSKEFHSLIQMVFQDPYQSLNPRKKAFDIIADPLRINTNKTEAEIKELVYAMMKKVGLREEFGSRYPHHFSGGQRQRLGIARALMLRPRVLILDEPVSALDVSIQAQVLNLLLELQKEFSLSYLFISHDLSVIQHISDRILVMYLGRIVEYGSRDEIFNNPKHPYTKILLESAPKIVVPETHPTRVETELSEAPSALYLPKGCAFAPRCPDRTDICLQSVPPLESKSKRMVACFNAR
ncbi:dipeptide ABC transporter ATP-binding protein [Bacteriovorax sp. PP10]|uniref:Dipeptide ABC transporter ATP-binding protein n=1 Tax=Bacteriovorax antarcticus TaxID=3088717 RepID=A0ABU5VYF8_9BACT|nr:dipeptide ABC transporter ATP-binding protein [Bacteriovorax sp. PP10]MEA9358105.1 dipeptide ABC transporter ATP-binding protein [Bacteriovorax sp. PP10]